MDAHLLTTEAVGFFAFPNPEFSPVATIQIAEPSARHQTRFVDARAQQCRFIVTDAAAEETICCGVPTSETSSWCIWHWQLVFVPRRDDRDRRKAA